MSSSPRKTMNKPERAFLLSVVIATLNLFSGVHLCSADVKAVGQKRDLAGIQFAQNLKYWDTRLRFLSGGPKGWYGCPQEFDASGQSKYAAFPYKSVVLYLKYYGNKRPSPFNPFFSINIHRNINPVSSQDALATYTSATLKLKSPDFLAPPRLAQFGDKEWAVCEYRLSANAKGKQIECIGKVYTLFIENSVVIIEGISTAEDFGTDAALFDKAVSGISWNHTAVEADVVLGN